MVKTLTEFVIKNIIMVNYATNDIKIDGKTVGNSWDNGR